MKDRYIELKKDLIDIIKIPRKSGDEEKIKNYFKEVADSLGLNVIFDGPNLIIEKINDEKDEDFVIVQAHMDMVYVKDADSHHEYQNGIDAEEKDGFLFADGTSLGADNGAGLSYILNLMKMDDENLPNLRFILTSEEEVGLIGAEKLSEKYLDAPFLINVDTEEEGVLFVGCAGGLRAKFSFDVGSSEADFSSYNAFVIKILCEKGGHSGMDISKPRGSAIKYIPDVLDSLGSLVSVTKIEAPGKANAISKEAEIYILTRENIDDIAKILKETEEKLTNEIYPSDKLTIAISECECTSKKVYDKNCLKRFSDTLRLLPQGVISMSPKIDDLVQTSFNMGKIDGDEELTLLCSGRSSVDSEMDRLIKKLELISAICESDLEIFNRYPAWEIKNSSKIVDISKSVYKGLVKDELELKAIHAGLECGYFNKKNDKIDMISMGPDIMNAHTTKEKIDLNSFYRTWEFLYHLLLELKNA